MLFNVKFISDYYKNFTIKQVILRLGQGRSTELSFY